MVRAYPRWRCALPPDGMTHPRGAVDFRAVVGNGRSWWIDPARRGCRELDDEGACEMGPRSCGSGAHEIDAGYRN